MERLENRLLLAGVISQVGYFDTWDSGDSRIADVTGITSHPSGRLYLADSGIDELPVVNGDNIFETSRTGDHVYREIASGNSEPTGITFNQFDGYFYVTNDTGAKYVTRYDGNLNDPRFQFSPQDDVPSAIDPEGIASDPATGSLYLADGSDGGLQVLAYNLDLSDSNEATRGVVFGGAFSVAGQMESVEGIAFHKPSGHLFLIDGTQNLIFEYTTAGTYLEQYDLSGFSPAPTSPQGLTFAPTSSTSDHANALSLYIADGGNVNAADGRVYEASISISDADATSITFRVMSDVPNNQEQQLAMEAELASVGPDDEFFVHLGDITAPRHCAASIYRNMANTLEASSIPAFIVPGDNEWNDCPDPDQAWINWESNLMGLEDHWSHGFTVMRQSVREENFAFVRAGVLFIGINLVGGTVHDASEWSQRMTDNANWVNENFNNFGSQVSSATIFAQAFPDPTGGDRQQFGQDFVTLAQDFGKPILFLQGDKHVFIYDRPYRDAPNVTRVVVDQRPSIRVSISNDPTSPFRVSNPIPDTPTNQPPVLAAIGNKSVDGDRELSFTAWANDPDVPENVLSFSLDPGAPTGATINPATGEFNWTPSEAQGSGVYSVTVRVSDDGAPSEEDFETFTITVNESNRPALEPIIAQSVDEGSLLTLTASASDPDSPANKLSFSLDPGAPVGATIDSITGEFSWIPGEVAGPGLYSVTVRVTDDGAPPMDDHQTFDITVSEVNQAPVLAAIGDQSVDEGSLLTFTASATDPDLPANNLSFSLDPDAPTGATIDSTTGVFRWTPGESAGPGIHVVTVRVTDDGTPALGDFETIEITVGEVNQAPVLAAIGNQSVIEGSLLTFTATATDPDLPANNLSFSLDAGSPAGATIDSTTGEFNWTPGEAAGPGVYSVTVRVTDDVTPALDDFETIEITIGEVNQAPVLSAIGNQSIDEGSLLTFTATAIDPDLPANNLSFSLDSGAPAGAMIDSTTGEFNWLPGEPAGPGVYPVTVRVTDNATPTLDDFETFDIIVGEVNQAPVLATIGDQNIDVGHLLTFTVSATDPDLPANDLFFSLDTGSPAGATIDPNTGEFRWTPDNGMGPAVHVVTVQVTDSGTPVRSDYETIEITVYDPLDVNHNGKVSALDALAIINQIGRLLHENEDVLGSGNQTAYHYDANDDGKISALDALLVINHLSVTNPEGDLTVTQVRQRLEVVPPVHASLLDDDLIRMLADDQHYRSLE